MCPLHFPSSQQTALVGNGRFGTSSTLSSSESNEYHEHTIWNPMLELLLRTHIGISMEALFCEEDMERISLSCHFALDVLCDKE